MRRNGYSIIEVLVATSIVGILFLALSQLLVNGFEGQRTVQQRQGAALLQLEVASLLNSRSVCTLNFRGRGSTATTPVITQLLSSDTPPTAAFRMGDTYSDGLLTLAGITLGNYQPYGTAGNERFRGTMDLSLRLVPVGKSLGASEMVRTIVLFVELNGYPPVSAGGANDIRTCAAANADQNSIWTLNPDGTVYYSGFNVGIGTSTPNQALEVNGRVLAQMYLHSSDERLKRDITAAPGLPAIEKINGVRFKWRDSGEPSMGLTAQNVEGVFPEAVTVNPHTHMKAVAYDQMIGPLIESVKDLARQNRELEQKVLSLEQRAAAKHSR